MNTVIAVLYRLAIGVQSSRDVPCVVNTAIADAYRLPESWRLRQVGRVYRFLRWTCRGRSYRHQSSPGKIQITGAITIK